MNIHFLGTTGYHPNRRRHTSCVMIPETGIILDAGTGIFRARELIRTDSLAVFLSHAHVDHCIGLTYFFDLLHEKGVAHVQVFGDAPKLAAIQRHLFAPELFPATPPFDWQDLPPGPIPLPDDGVLSWIALDHPGSSIGYRLDWPERSLAYITDTTASADAPYIDFIRGVDLLIHECNFPDGFEQLALQTGHSCLTPVAELSQKAGVGMTILTHFNGMDESDQPIDPTQVRSIFDKIFLAQDEMVVEL